MKKYFETAMKWKVECRYADRGIIERTAWEDSIPDNYVGDYITADTADEAIEIAIEYITREVERNGYTDENGETYAVTTAADEDGIHVYIDSEGEEPEIVGQYYHFYAMEEKKESKQKNGKTF